MSACSALWPSEIPEDEDEDEDADGQFDDASLEGEEVEESDIGRVRSDFANPDDRFKPY